jgi:hypothetical protein
MGCNQHGSIVRRMRLILCKSAGWICGLFSVGWGKMGPGGLVGREAGGPFGVRVRCWRGAERLPGQTQKQGVTSG